MARKRKPSGRRLSDKGKKVGKRPVRTRPLRPRYLIVCEGVKTEPNYFRSFRVQADVEVIGTGRDTIDVVKHAQRLEKQAQQEGMAYTHVWAVFDRDEFPPEKFNAAIQYAERNGIKAAYSNPAFEFWYILHFQYHDTPISRQQCENILTKRLGARYVKNHPSIRQLLIEQEDEAIARAERLYKSYQNDHNPARDNPCTTVFWLVKELKRFSV